MPIYKQWLRKVKWRNNLEPAVTQSLTPKLFPKNQALLCGGPGDPRRASPWPGRTVPGGSTLGARLCLQWGQPEDTENTCGVVGPMQGLLPPPSGSVFPLAK